MKIILNNNILDNIDMSFSNPTVTFKEKSGVDHYRLLAHISTLFKNEILIDIGTRSGASAIALAMNDENIVHSFDIEDIKSKTLYKNVTYHICDVLQNQSYHDMILNSPFISLDTQHDGIFEVAFLTFLRNNAYKGILYLDDINTDKYPDMRPFWNNIIEKKFDITQYAHFSGSGLVIFNENTDVIFE